MTNALLNFAVLKGYKRLELDDSELAGLDRLYKEIDIELHDISWMAGHVEGFNEFKTPVPTEDKYPWFAGTVFTIGPVEITVLFPWPQDMKKAWALKEMGQRKGDLTTSSMSPQEKGVLKRTIMAYYRTLDDSDIEESFVRKVVAGIMSTFSAALSERFGSRRRSGQ